MASKRKRKSDGSQVPKFPPELCILHVIGISHGPFTSLRNVKEGPDKQFAHLHEIRSKRITEPHCSPYRMEVICNQIPETIDGANLDSLGYRRHCYQRFTSNLHRLKGTKSVTETATSHKKTSFPTQANISKW